MNCLIENDYIRELSKKKITYVFPNELPNWKRILKGKNGKKTGKKSWRTLLRGGFINLFRELAYFIVGGFTNSMLTLYILYYIYIYTYITPVLLRCFPMVSNVVKPRVSHLYVTTPGTDPRWLHFIGGWDCRWLSQRDASPMFTGSPSQVLGLFCWPIIYSIDLLCERNGSSLHIHEFYSFCPPVFKRSSIMHRFYTQSDFPQTHIK